MIKLFKHYLISICIVLGLAGCTNAITPKEYNKAEELCKNANQSVETVTSDTMRDYDSDYRLKVFCTNNVIIYSSVN